MMASSSTLRIAGMIGKEFRQALRDPGSFAVVFIVPVMLMLLMGFGINLDINRVPVGISMHDQSASARSLASAFQSSRFFKVTEVAPVAQLAQSMEAGRLRGIIVIPAEFGREAARGGGRIQVLTDGSFPNPASLLARYIEGVYADWAVRQAMDRGLDPVLPISTDARFWFNPGVSSTNFLVPGAVAVVMTVVGSLLTALVVAREWERGTIESLMSTPIGMSEFLISKLLPYFAFGMAAMAICTVIALGIFEVPFRGSLLALTVLSAAYLVPALSQGLLISAVFKNQFVASQIAVLTTFLPTLLLSNYVFEIASMPLPIQLITTIVPARYFIPQLLTVFLAGDDWGQFAQGIAVLLCFGGAMLALCRLATRRRIA